MTNLTARVPKELHADWGRQYVLPAADARQILATSRDRLPPDIFTPLSAVEDSSRDPPSHILLKPSQFARLAKILDATERDAAQTTSDRAADATSQIP